jgi:hypothetical protein
MTKKQQNDTDIPQHILESDHLSGVQKKAFAKAKRAAKREEKEEPKKRAKSAESGGYGSGSGKEEKP